MLSSVEYNNNESAMRYACTSSYFNSRITTMLHNNFSHLITLSQQFALMLCYIVTLHVCTHLYAWFTFSSRQHKTRRERECEQYIYLVCHILDLFLSHLGAPGRMSVNQYRVKGNENVLTLSRSSHTRG